MGNQSTTMTCNFEDMQQAIENKCIILNTLHEGEQSCLISHSVPSAKEVDIMNQVLATQKETSIYVYGKNCNDESAFHKYNQLIGLGCTRVFLYKGGLFEWLCLQDIYGDDEFQTTTRELDILKYKPKSAKREVLLIE